jgi:hypothetical protein
MSDGMIGNKERRANNRPLVVYRNWAVTWNDDLDDVWITSPQMYSNENIWRPNVPIEASCTIWDRIAKGENPKGIHNHHLLPAGILYRHSQGEAAPVSQCTCGLYGYFRMKERVQFRIDYPINTAQISGAAAVWGKVIHHSKGVRAQHGQLVAFLWPDYIDDIIPGLRHLLATKYCLPIFNDKRALVTYARQKGKTRDRLWHRFG